MLQLAEKNSTGGQLTFKEISKHYGNTIALASFSHEFESGKVHALMGKNGSGKSTLVKLLAGAIRPTNGQILKDGEIQDFASPHDAFNAGVVTVHQELSLVPELSVGENIFLGRLPKQKRFGANVVNWGSLFEQSNKLLQEMGLDIDPRRPVSSLSVGQQQVVEIAKAMSFNPAILLLDEPTSALASKEVSLLFNLVKTLRSRGVTIIYITHRMSELFEIADTCTVIRDGILIGSVEMDVTTPSQIVDMMFGDTANLKRPPRQKIQRDTPILEVKNLSDDGHFHDVSFKLYEGEILGIAGLLGSGRTELMRAIFGADPINEGRVLLNGEEVKNLSPEHMRNHGLGYTPENRKEFGLVQLLPTSENLCMSSLDSISAKGIISKDAEASAIAKQVEELSIKTGDLHNPVSSLSGGNQQKVVIGKWLNTSPKIMLFDEPSRGVDVQAKRQIFDIIWAKSAEGLASIFVSTELEEVLEVADRILIMRSGKIVEEVDPTKVDLTDIYTLCMEGEKNE